MFCPNCGQETEPEKRCTNCGAPLPEEESAATADSRPIPNTADVQTSVTAGAENEQTINKAHDQAQEPTKPNEFVETLKRESINFGHFFWNMLKGPDEAKKINQTSMTPAIITMVIFSILIALGSYITARQIAVFEGVSFVDSFLLPLIQFIILFMVIVALVFCGAKTVAQSLSFTGVIAKVGAYTVPFLVLTVVGSLLTLIGISVASILVILGLLGPIIIVPTLVLLEQPANGFDRIYVLLGIYIISLLISGILIQSVMSNLVGGMMSGIISNFSF